MVEGYIRLQQKLPFITGGDSSHGRTGIPSHLLMVLLHIGQLLIQALNLHLQVSPGQGQLIQHPAQAIDVSFHTLAQGQLVLIPETLKIKFK